MVHFIIGLGIMAYGATYFIVHDIFIHQRFKMFRKANNWYAKGIRRAHKIHHKHTGKEDGECFGMLIVPLKFLKSRMLFKMVYDYDYIIIGAGMAGLQLANAFIDDSHFKSKSILIIEPSSKNPTEKTWCFWEKGVWNLG